MHDTIFPADTVEFCPHPLARNIFVCGTYQLDEGQSNINGGQKRRGQCLVFELEGDANNFKKLQEINNLPAVLDLKWCHHTDPPILSVADSEGNVSFFEWDSESHRLMQTAVFPCAPSSSVLCLSLDWSNRLQQSPGSLVISLSNGNLSVLPPENPAKARTWLAHDYEPWIAAWDYWDTNVVYSGGDDLQLKAWDVRKDCSDPIFANKRFEAGVTSIQSHPHREHMFAVGSYDTILRVYDKRRPHTPISQAAVGGGIWRVKWHPSVSRKDDAVVACMHDGFKVVRFDLDAADTGMEIVKRFDEHGSLAYGVDWCFVDDGQRETKIASCSFYDHALEVWSA